MTKRNRYCEGRLPPAKFAISQSAKQLRLMKSWAESNGHPFIFQARISLRGLRSETQTARRHSRHKNIRHAPRARAARLIFDGADIRLSHGLHRAGLQVEPRGGRVSSRCSHICPFVFCFSSVCPLLLRTFVSSLESKGN